MIEGKKTISQLVAERVAEQKIEGKALKPKLSKISKHAKGKAKILTLDIETSPNLAFVWGLWQQNVSLAQLQESGAMICFVAKWYDSKDVIFSSDFHDGHEVMVKKLWDLIDEADMVVHFNGVSFDMPIIHREFVELGMTPPSTYKNIDLMRVVKKQFRFPSNKLDYVSDRLGLGKKTVHTGFQLWMDCLRGDPKAWALMKKYNIQDVKLTEALYDRLRGWIPNHPHFGMFTGDAWSCPNCGHEDLSTNLVGVAHTNVQTYNEYRCPNCGKQVRSTAKQLNPTRTRSSANG